MYVEPGFYDLREGTIGTVQYKLQQSPSMTQAQKEELVSKMSNESMRAFMMQFTLGQSDISPEEAFMKSRKDAWSQIEEAFIIKDLHVQVGQKESYDEILRIEEQEGFVGWMNPLLVDSLKKVYLNEEIM